MSKLVEFLVALAGVLSVVAAAVLVPTPARSETLATIPVHNCEAYGNEFKLVAWARDVGVTEAQMDQLLGFMVVEIHPSIVPVKQDIIRFVYNAGKGMDALELQEKATQACELADGVLPRLAPNI